MLLRNYSYINHICGHNHSGITNPMHFIAPHKMRGYFAPQDLTNIEQNKRDSLPTGTNPPYSLMMGDKGALLSATTTINGTCDLTSAITSGINIESALTGSGTITNAQLSLIVQLAASLSGSGTITVANLVGVVSLAASLSGTGSLAAGLSLISNMSAALSGSGTISAELKGILSMEANIFVNQSEAEVQQIVDGVWNALTVDFNNPGTMGEALGAAGTAGDPWLTLLPGAYGAGTAGSIIGNMSAAAIADAVMDELMSGHTIPGSFADELRKKLSQNNFIALK